MTASPLPKQLQESKFKFCLIRAKDKKPFENEWQNKGYSFNSPVLLEHVKKANYGVICGGESKLLAVDFDDPELIKTVAPKLPATFTVKTGSGKIHKYFFADDTKAFALKGIDVRGDRTQVVGAGSTHPSGGKYEVLDDLPIAKIKTSELKQLLGVNEDIAQVNESNAPATFEADIEAVLSDKGIASMFYSQVPATYRSELESKLVVALIRKGLSKAQVFDLMKTSKIGKWQTASEAYREKTFDKARTWIQKEKNLPKETILTEEELSILKDKDLFRKITIDELDKKIVGEVENRQTIFLCSAGGRLVSNASPASFNILVSSDSGAGKDHVTGNVLKLLGEVVQKRTRISPTAFSYWHSPKTEPDWTWDGKVCYLTDISADILNSPVFKVMCTEGSHTTVVVEHKAIDIEIKGKPVMLITTATAQPNSEMLRRFPILNLTETAEQTRKIMERISSFAETGQSVEYDERIVKALAGLKRVKVKVPFATKLVGVFGNDALIMRTHWARLLDYIKASTALHQHQREQDDEGFLIATSDDYDIARIAIQQTTSNSTMTPLSKQNKRLLDSASLNWESVSEIAKRFPEYEERTIRRWLGMMSALKLLEMDSQKRDDIKKPVAVFRRVNFGVFVVPSWEQIEDKCRKMSINTVVSSKSNESVKSSVSNKSVVSEGEKEAFKRPVALSDTIDMTFGGQLSDKSFDLRLSERVLASLDALGGFKKDVSVVDLMAHVGCSEMALEQSLNFLMTRTKAVVIGKKPDTVRSVL